MFPLNSPIHLPIHPLPLPPQGLILARHRVPKDLERPRVGVVLPGRETGDEHGRGRTARNRGDGQGARVEGGGCGRGTWTTMMERGV